MYIESDTLELKEILTKEIKKEIIAFANSSGGKIFIGINDAGKIIGLKNPKMDLEALTGMINEGIKPNLIEYTKIKIERIDDKDVIILNIQKAPNYPYYLSEKGLKPSGVYIRHGSSTIQASDELIKRMIFENNGLRFEEVIANNQNLTFEYLERKFKDNNIEFNKSKYKTLNMINDKNKFTNLALLLSDECPYSIKCAIFNGNDKLEFRDRKEFKGSVLKQVDDLFEYFDLFNKISGKIIGLKRVDTKDYPTFSLREGLLNAVIHRNYYFNGSILISLYDNRFEIVSMGGLVDGINIEDIYRGVSSSRNPNLANIFYRLEYIESFGTGIGRIMDSYKDSKLKPAFSVTDNTFLISLPNINYNEDNSIIVINTMSQEDAIINYLKKYNKINRSETEKLLNVSKTRAFYILNSLIEKNIIMQNSTGKNTYYILK